MGKSRKQKTIITWIAALMLLVICATIVQNVVAGKTDVCTISNPSLQSQAEVFLVPRLTYEHVENTAKNPYNQRAYSLPNTYGIKNYGCAVTAYITAINIVHGVTLNPHNYVNNDDDAYCTWGYKVSDTKFAYKGKYETYNQSTMCQLMANELKNGYPVIFRINKGDGSYHFVLVTGVKEVSCRTQCYYDDFICIDPNTGAYCNLLDAYAFRSSGASIKRY